ncbi:MAG: hypothetical protein RL060_182 [Bacteroidota bacterium]|jgi:uncharacterized membrane protein YebE (DUF533 family)
MFGLFKNKEEVDKHSHLINLVALAKSDGRVDEKEIDLLRKIAISNGITEKAFLAILKTSDPLDIDISFSKENRVSQLFDFIQMMLIDEEVTPTEIKFCTEVAEKMNFNPQMVATLVDTMMEKIKAGQPKNIVCKAMEALVDY